MNVAKLLLSLHILGITRGFILERGHTSVLNVARLFSNGLTSLFTKEFMLEINHRNVISVVWQIL